MEEITFHIPPDPADDTDIFVEYEQPSPVSWTYRACPSPIPVIITPLLPWIPSDESLKQSILTSTSDEESRSINKKKQHRKHKQTGGRSTCPVDGCFKVYAFKSDMKKHVTEAHPFELANLISEPRSTKIGKPFPCPFIECQCGYLRVKDMRRHVVTKHGNM
jgi:hypothetical protein